MRGKVAKKLRRLGKFLPIPERQVKRAWYGLPWNRRKLAQVEALIRLGKLREAEAKAARDERDAG